MYVCALQIFIRHHMYSIMWIKTAGCVCVCVCVCVYMCVAVSILKHVLAEEVEHMCHYCISCYTPARILIHSIILSYVVVYI